MLWAGPRGFVRGASSRERLRDRCEHLPSQRRAIRNIIGTGELAVTDFGVSHRYFKLLPESFDDGLDQGSYFCMRYINEGCPERGCSGAEARPYLFRRLDFHRT